MRILMALFNAVGRGTYWRAYHLGRGLARRGHAVTLLATAPTRRVGFRRTESEGLGIVETPDMFHGSLRSGWDPWNVLNRIIWMRGQKFDVVHAFETRPVALYPARFAARGGRAPLVIDWADWFGRGGSVEERPNPLVRAALRPVETYFEERGRMAAGAHTVICNPLRERALALGLPPDRILLLPNGSSTDRLQPLPQAQARARMGLPSGELIIGYVGTVFQGDAGLMVKSFDAVRSQIPGARLLIAGYSPFDIRPLVNAPDAVIQTGPLDGADLNWYLAACDLFWLPLRDTNANQGRFPLKLTDYLAVGRPVVATSVGDVPAIVADGPVGLLSPDEPEAFAAQTTRLWADPSLRAEMGRRARSLAEGRYNWDTLAGSLAAFYQWVLAN